MIGHPLLRHYMRGYFDGDGCASISNRQKRFTLRGTPEFLEIYRDMMRYHCQFLYKNKVSKSGNGYQLEFHGNKKVAQICEFLYKNSTIHLLRKRRIFDGI